MGLRLLGALSSRAIRFSLYRDDPAQIDMLAETILVPDDRSVAGRRDRDELRMRYLELTITRQHQPEWLERSRFRESPELCEIHCANVPGRQGVSISRLP